MMHKPFILTIFGAFGNLASKSIFPSLFALQEQGRLPDEFFVMGYGRSSKTDEELRDKATFAIQKARPDASEEDIEKLVKKFYYCQGAYDEANGFFAMEEKVQELTKSKKLPHLMYFAVPPNVYEDIVRELGSSLTHPDEARLIFEKPFGTSEESARALFHHITRYFKAEQVFLIDHYLGKSGVQSILFLRQANKLIAHALQGEEIANIQIHALEEEGIKERAGYFDQTGTLRDFVQSHVLQMVALATMAIPTCKNPESMQREKISILHALKFDKNKPIVQLGQYKGYLSEQGVKEGSKTDTFVALRTLIDREEWFGVPIYIRSGKGLAKKATYIVFELKKQSYQAETDEPNRIIMEIQPHPKLSIHLINRTSNFDTSENTPLVVESSIACYGDDCLPEHAQLLSAAIRGDRMYFVSEHEVFASWMFLEQVEAVIQEEKIQPEQYAKGDFGPKASNEIPESDNFTWYDL